MRKSEQQDLYENNPRDLALELVYSDRVAAREMLLCCLKFMGHEDVRNMLDANELSPRFLED